MSTLKLLLLFSFASASIAQDAVYLTLTSDLPARVELDGKDAGFVEPGTPLRIEATPGEHQVQAVAEGEVSKWRKLVFVSAALPTSLAIPMRAHLLRGEIHKTGFWKDERTSFYWAAEDNGSGVTVSQANFYCTQLRVGGFSDWRLPEIDDLQRLFGGTGDERGFRVIVPLKLSGWAWSATRGNEPAENWALDFGDGARASVVAGDAGLNRALCVRSVRP